MSSSQSSALEQRFELTKRDSTVRKEIVAGLTTFLAMVYSVIVVPNMLSAAGFPAESVFIATCLVAGLGSIFNRLLGKCADGNWLCHFPYCVYCF